MKIFHTADWHIGKTLLNKSFISEQREVLNKFIEKIEKENPDLIIIAGDLYDKPIPQIEAIKLLNEVLEEIVLTLNKEVLIVSGNHDSAERLSFGTKIFEEKGLTIRTNMDNFEKPITIEDEYGAIDIYMLPFITPVKARILFKDMEIKSYNDILQYNIEVIDKNIDMKRRNICIYHGYVIYNDKSKIESDSERLLSIGGSEYVDVNLFKNFDYVALGHLHGPQKVKENHIRYSGSLLKYSFSETNQKKGVTVVELGKKNRPIEYQINEIYPEKDMKIIEGTFEEIEQLEVFEKDKDNYIMIKLHSDREIYSLREKLEKRFKNILKIEIVRTDINDSEKLGSMVSSVKEKNTLKLFEQFYENSKGSDLTEKSKNKLKKLLEEIE